MKYALKVLFLITVSFSCSNNNIFAPPKEHVKQMDLTKEQMDLVVIKAESAAVETQVLADLVKKIAFNYMVIFQDSIKSLSIAPYVGQVQGGASRARELADSAKKANSEGRVYDLALACNAAINEYESANKIARPIIEEYNARVDAKNKADAEKSLRTGKPASDKK